MGMLDLKVLLLVVSMLSCFISRTSTQASSLSILSSYRPPEGIGIRGCSGMPFMLAGNSSNGVVKAGSQTDFNPCSFYMWWGLMKR